MTFEQLPDGRLLGYKVMGYDPDTGDVISGANSRIRLNLDQGATHRMPAPGIFLGATAKYVLDYYAGHEYNALITYSFDPTEVTSGSLTDREPEITVPKATVESFSVYDEDLNEVFERGNTMLIHKGAVYVQAADPTKDREYRDLAEEAYDKYVAFLGQVAATDWDDIDWDGPFDLYGGNDNSTFYSVDFSAVDSRYQDLQVNIGPYPRGNRGPTGVHSSSPLLKKAQITIGAVPPEDLEKEDQFGSVRKVYPNEQLDILRKNVPKTVFVHEFIHHLDYLRRKGEQRKPEWKDVGAPRKQRTRTEYLSTPPEFNAWYQASIRELEDYLDEVAEFFPEDLNDYMSTKQRFVDKALELFSSKYLAKGQSFLWDVDLLDDKYRRKLLKRLHGFYDYYVQKLEEPEQKAASYRQAADPTRDREFRQQALEAWEKVLQYLRDYKATPYYGKFLVWFERFAPEYKWLLLAVGPKRADGVKGSFGEAHFPRAEYAIELAVLDESFWEHEEEFIQEELLWDLNTQDVKTTFVHEFVHYLDRKRRGTPELSKKELEQRVKRKTDPVEYFSNPEEFNAWYQALTHELENVLHEMWVEGEYGESPPSPEKTLGTYKDFFDFFDLFNQNRSSNYWPLEKLQPKWQRKLTKRLYGLWEDLQGMYL